MIYLFVRPRPGQRGPQAFGYQHLWPDLRQLIWDPGTDYPEDDVCAVCGCFRWHCEGPGRCDDQFDAETACRCRDDEFGEPTC